MKAMESIGRNSVRGIDGIGFGTTLMAESLYWLVAGRWNRQPVRLDPIMAQAVEVGLRAVPIATLLSATIGFMLAIQSLYSLGLFGAESYAFVGIALSVTREFSPLIIGILVAGRSGSALAARLATMTINQEVDALRVIGVSPVRYLLSPMVISMIILLPMLTAWSCVVALLAAALFVSSAMDTTMLAFLSDVMSILSVGDILHGLGKSAVFALLIVAVGAVNGAMVSGGADGVGRQTTRAVVHGISAIVIADMLFAFLVI